MNKFNNILKDYPLLRPDGFSGTPWHEFKTTQKEMEDQYNSLLPIIEEAVRKCRTRYITRSVSSHWVKGIVERILGENVSEGALIAAYIHFDLKLEPFPNTNSVRTTISLKWWKRVIKTLDRLNKHRTI